MVILGWHRSVRFLFLAFLFLPLAMPLKAEPLNEANPFAEKHLVLQVSGREQHAAVLNIANNLIKHYGPDIIDIQVVTFASGIDLLRRDENPHRKRVASLQASGVRFYVCQNTVNALKHQGVEFHQLETVDTVASGVAHILEETERGYTLVAP